MWIRESWLAVVLPSVAQVEQPGEEVGDVCAPEVDAGMEPGARVYRRYVRGGVDVRSLGVVGAQGAELFGVPLLDAAEAAELALDAVEVAVVVAVAW